MNGEALSTIERSNVINWEKITWLNLGESMVSRHTGIGTTLLLFDPGGGLISLKFGSHLLPNNNILYINEFQAEDDVEERPLADCKKSRHKSLGSFHACWDAYVESNIRMLEYHFGEVGDLLVANDKLMAGYWSKVDVRDDGTKQEWNVSLPYKLSGLIDVGLPLRFVDFRNSWIEGELYGILFRFFKFSLVNPPLKHELHLFNITFWDGNIKQWMVGLKKLTEIDPIIGGNWVEAISHFVLSLLKLCLSPVTLDVTKGLQLATLMDIHSKVNIYVVYYLKVVESKLRHHSNKMGWLARLYIDIFVPWCNLQTATGPNLTRGRVVQWEGWNDIDNYNTIIAKLSIVTISSCLSFWCTNSQFTETLKLFHKVVNGLDPPKDSMAPLGASMCWICHHP